MRLTLRVLALFGLLTAILGFGFSCSKPNKPVEKKGLRLYINDGLTHNIYVFDPTTHELLDSLGDNYAGRMVISRDGRYLFTTNSAPGYVNTLRKIQTQPLQWIAQLPMAGELVFLEQGSILLRPGSTNLFYIDPVALEITGTDSIGMRAVGAADTTGIIVGIDAKERLTVYDFRNKIVLAADSVFLPDGLLARCKELELHPSGTQAYGLFQDSYSRAWFIIFDVPSLEPVGYYEVVFPFGDIAASPDGQYVLLNDPGDVPHGYLVGLFLVYEVTTNSMVRIVHTDTLSLSGIPSLSTIAYSPDGSRAFVSTGGFGWAAGPILIFDMEELEFVDKIEMPFEWMPDPIVAGVEP